MLTQIPFLARVVAEAMIRLSASYIYRNYPNTIKCMNRAQFETSTIEMNLTNRGLAKQSFKLGDTRKNLTTACGDTVHPQSCERTSAA